MSIALVTQGYLYTVCLVLALWLALNGKSPSLPFVPLDKRLDGMLLQSPNVARLLATSLAMGIFLCAMLLWADAFVPTAAEMPMLLP